MATGISYVDVFVKTVKLVKRFWSYCGDRTENNCWNWRGALFTNGYGQFRWGKRKVKAHRIAWWLLYGPIPYGKIICHTCDNKRCVNPNHLFMGTHKDNAEDREKKGRHPHINKSRFGEKNPACKLTPSIVRTIRRYRQLGHTYSALQSGVKLGWDISISKSQIANIVHKRSWKNVR